MTARTEHGTPEGRSARTDAYLDQEEEASFPASDAHGDWAGPPSWLPGDQGTAGGAGPDRGTDEPDG